MNLVGERYGRLTVIAREPNNVGRWQCRCDCGAIKAIDHRHLRNGQVRSCGCLRRETVARRNTTHGLRFTPEYRAWAHMIGRCTRPSDREWKNYGGRGIGVCQEWLDSFEAFYAHVGQRPSAGYSLDRINNDGHYEPGNVRWATRSQQVANQRPRRRNALGQLV